MAYLSGKVHTALHLWYCTTSFDVFATLSWYMWRSCADNPALSSTFIAVPNRNAPGQLRCYTKKFSWMPTVHGWRKLQRRKPPCVSLSPPIATRCSPQYLCHGNALWWSYARPCETREGVSLPMSARPPHFLQLWPRCR